MFKKTVLLTVFVMVSQAAAPDSVGAPVVAAVAPVVQLPPSFSEIKGYFSDFGSHARAAASHGCQSIRHTGWSLVALKNGCWGLGWNILHFVNTHPATTAVLALAIVGGGSYIYVKFDRSKRRRG
jgi:hypothetical protein